MIYASYNHTGDDDPFDRKLEMDAEGLFTHFFPHSHTNRIRSLRSAFARCMDVKQVAPRQFNRALCRFSQQATCDVCLFMCSAVHIWERSCRQRINDLADAHIAYVQFTSTMINRHPIGCDNFVYRRTQHTHTRQTAIILSTNARSLLNYEYLSGSSVLRLIGAPMVIWIVHNSFVCHIRIRFSGVCTATPFSSAAKPWVSSSVLLVPSVIGMHFISEWVISRWPQVFRCARHKRFIARSFGAFFSVPVSLLSPVSVRAFLFSFFGISDQTSPVSLSSMHFTLPIYRC